MWSALAFILFPPFALAASFTSAPKINEYSQLKPKSDLIKELSKADGVPNFSSTCDLMIWMSETVEEKLFVSESVARWAMLAANYFTFDTHRFFKYVMDKFGYVSLVKDLIDYKGSSYFLGEYLERHRLRHFPHLPASLRNVVAEMAELEYEMRYLYPLMSDYSINHPEIQRDRMLPSTAYCSPSLFKFTLICHCLGAIELHPLFYPKNFVDLAIIEEVSQEFPEQMKKFIDGLEETEKTFLTIYRSNELPSEAFWQEMVGDAIWRLDRFYEHDCFHSLIGDLIHRLFHNQRDWILKRFQELRPDVQIAYFSARPTDLLEDALPT